MHVETLNLACLGESVEQSASEKSNNFGLGGPFGRQLLLDVCFAPSEDQVSRKDHGPNGVFWKFCSIWTPLEEKLNCHRSSKPRALCKPLCTFSAQTLKVSTPLFPTV
jgi:hypothetical protein